MWQTPHHSDTQHSQFLSVECSRTPILQGHSDLSPKSPLQKHHPNIMDWLTLALAIHSFIISDLLTVFLKRSSPPSPPQLFKACRTLVPQPVIKLCLLKWKHGSPDHWSARELLKRSLITYSSTCSNSIREETLSTLVAQLVKNPPAMRETWIRSLGWEDHLGKEKATHSSILAWRIPRTV